MTCNYFEYKHITKALFYGVALTDNHMNNATEQIRKYLVHGGAGDVVNALGIGIKIEENQCPLFPELNQIVKRRFVFVNGENKGRELTIDEIEGIGLFLKHGAFYGRLKM
jgi:hypothetical protein